MECQKYPLDFDALVKGSVITVDQLESITGFKQGSEEYAFKVMALRDQIERELHQRGHNWTVAQVKRNLKVLTDGEAVLHNERKFKAGFAMQVQAHWRAEGVDVAQLSDGEKERHTRNLCLQAAQILASKQARRLALSAKKRDVPSLPNGK
jgi:hypothetical protein